MLWTWLDTPIRLGLYDIWPDLSQERKLELIAKARAEDTMKAWETHLMNEATK